MEKVTPIVTVVACALLEGKEILIVRRGPDQSGAGEWEFPGGKVETGESQVQALQREIQEELGVEIAVGPLVAENKHSFPGKTIHLFLYQCSLKSGFTKSAIKLSEHDAQEWVILSKLHAEKLSLPDQPFVEVLKKISV